MLQKQCQIIKPQADSRALMYCAVYPNFRMVYCSYVNNVAASTIQDVRVTGHRDSTNACSAHNRNIVIAVFS